MAKRRHISNDLAASLGRRVALARRSRNVTQVQLAQLVGVSQSNISHYERGDLIVPTDLLIKLCKVLRVSADFMLGLTSTDKKKVTTKAPDLDTPSVRRAWKTMLKVVELPERDQRAVRRLVDSLTGRKTSSASMSAA